MGRDFVCFLLTFLFLKRTVCPFASYKGKVCGKVQLFLTHSQLRVWWGTKAHSWLVGLAAPSTSAEGPWPWAASGYKDPDPQRQRRKLILGWGLYPSSQEHFCGKAGSVLGGFIFLRRVHEYLVKWRNYYVVSASYIYDSSARNSAQIRLQAVVLNWD